MKNNRILLRLTAVLAAAMVALAGTPACAKTTKTSTAASIATQTGVTIPAYSGNPFAAVNNNVPYFTKADLTTTPFELYSDLDDLGRCGTAYANVCQDLMPTEPRGDIGPIKPTGWHSVKYAGIDGNYLFNRCHLIGYQLTGENANEKNLITGTQHMNIDGMRPFEIRVARSLDKEEGQILYRVTPLFRGDDRIPFVGRRICIFFPQQDQYPLVPCRKRESCILRRGDRNRCISCPLFRKRPRRLW